MVPQTPYHRPWMSAQNRRKSHSVASPDGVPYTPPSRPRTSHWPQDQTVDLVFPRTSSAPCLRTTGTLPGAPPHKVIPRKIAVAHRKDQADLIFPSTTSAPCTASSEKPQSDQNGPPTGVEKQCLDFSERPLSREDNLTQRISSSWDWMRGDSPSVESKSIAMSSPCSPPISVAITSPNGKALGGHATPTRDAKLESPRTRQGIHAALAAAVGLPVGDPRSQRWDRR